MLRNWRDLAPALIFAAFAIGAFAVTFEFRSVPAAFAQGMQASAMPRLILGFILVLTVLLLLFGYGSPEPEREEVSWPVWATKGVLLAAAFSLEPLGVTLTLFLVMLAIPLLWGERRYGVLALYAVLAPAAIYLLFTKVLMLRLPQGPLAAFL